MAKVEDEWGDLIALVAGQGWLSLMDGNGLLYFSFKEAAISLSLRHIK